MSSSPLGIGQYFDHDFGILDCLFGTGLHAEFAAHDGDVGIEECFDGGDPDFEVRSEGLARGVSQLSDQLRQGICRNASVFGSAAKHGINNSVDLLVTFKRVSLEVEVIFRGESS